MGIATPFWAFAVLALLFAGYVAAGGRAIFYRQERPERLVGKVVSFSGVDGLGKVDLPKGLVTGFQEFAYIIQPQQPIVVNGVQFNSFQIRARHWGYPVSSATRHGLTAVTGSLSDALGFIACVNVAG